MAKRRSSNADRPSGTLAIVLGDQLDASYLKTLGLDPDADTVLMMEVKSASLQPPSHVQRTVLFLAAMRHHAEIVRKDGWSVDYRKITDKNNTQTFEGEIRRAIRVHKPGRVACISPGAFELKETIASICVDEKTRLHVENDPHFLCSTEEFGDWADGRKQLVMEYFYREQRNKLGVLMDDHGKPTGGSWNYDKQNRKAFKSAPKPPAVPTFKPDDITQHVIDDVQRVLPELPGRGEGFNWPVTRRQALRLLKDFIENRLPRFGDYQDAMWAGEHTLYHSLLSTSLNLKLLNPREVYRAALDAYEAGDAPLNAVEGFVRQVIGWREFIRGIYWYEGEGYADRNHLGQHGSLPGFYWTGETDMNCMRHAIQSVLDLAYGHHIARLMITGNFALIAGVDPAGVNDWYLGMYADAVEWVTTPNTVGMAMHADGGVVGTKPYAASGKYVQRMSNYCKVCRYNVDERTGENACPFNTFYWDFLIRNEQRFSENRRMAMILKHVHKMDKDQRVQITSSAKSLRERMGIGQIA